MTTLPDSPYLLFLDESGDHGMQHCDAGQRMFVLLGVLVGEKYYQRSLVPRVKAFKAAYGLGPTAVLHSRGIRRWEDEFQFLRDDHIRERFHADLGGLITGLRIRIFAVVIDKAHLHAKFLFPVSPYHVSLSLLLSQVGGVLRMPARRRRFVTSIIAESRGKREDKDLQREFQGFRQLGLWNYGAVDVQSRLPQTVARFFPTHVDFVPKRRVVAGLELADLTAYPIARAYLRDDWARADYLAVQSKLIGPVVFP